MSPCAVWCRLHKRGSTEDKGTPKPKKKPGDPDYDPYDFDSDDEGRLDGPADTVEDVDGDKHLTTCGSLFRSQTDFHSRGKWE